MSRRLSFVVISTTLLQVNIVVASNSEHMASAEQNISATTTGDDNNASENVTLSKKETSELAESRLKVLGVDVNAVMSKIDTGVNWTANQLDGYFAENEREKNKARAWGHVVFAWQPQEGQLADAENFPVKFKVKAKLPNLENKVEIILSDGDDDDFETLPYESVRPDALKLSDTSFGAAIQFLSSEGKYVDTSSRLGISESQVYARSSLTYRNTYFDNTVIFNLRPAIEYYHDDGWGARILLDAGYKINQTSELRYNMLLRDRESYDDMTCRSGIFHIYSFGEKSAFITGYSVAGDLEESSDLQIYSRRMSTRYRFNALRGWIFFEIEPFVEFEKDDIDLLNEEPETFRYQFEKNRGITFRFEAHYGYL